MNEAHEDFLAEIEDDPRIADLADDVRHGLELLWNDPTALDLTDGCTWIFRQPRSVTERLEAVNKLLTAIQAAAAKNGQGEFRVNLARFLGWS